MNLEVEIDSQTLLANLSRLPKPGTFTGTLKRSNAVHPITITRPAHGGGGHVPGVRESRLEASAPPA